MGERLAGQKRVLLRQPRPCTSCRSGETATEPCTPSSVSTGQQQTATPVAGVAAPGAHLRVRALRQCRS